MHYGFSWCLAGFCSQTCAQISQTFELSYDSDLGSGQVNISNALAVLRTVRKAPAEMLDHLRAFGPRVSRYFSASGVLFSVSSHLVNAVHRDFKFSSFRLYD